MTTSAQDLAARIQSKVGALKAGTLRFWGVWFGRPYDNWHRVIRATADGDCLLVEFDAGEVLRVWAPERFRIDESSFVIQHAARVRWEWFSYGQPKTEENLRFQDFVRDADAVQKHDE